MNGGRVVFVGGGPGAADLLTLRAASALEAADIVIWGRALLTEDAVREHVRAGAELIAWPPATLADVLAAYDRARDEGLTVVRLKSGDPTLHGELEPELSEARERGLAVELVPGVASLTAAAAALGFELSPSGRPVLVSGGRDELDRGALAELARTGGTAAFLLPGGRAAEVQQALLEGGFDPGGPCAVAHRVSWPGEVLLRCTVARLGEEVDELGLTGLTLFVAGPAAAPRTQVARSAGQE